MLLRIVFATFMTLGFAATSYADSAFIDGNKISEKVYTCTNGGMIQFTATRYGNMKKITFAKAGSLNQFGYALFNHMTDSYSGSIYTSVKYPETKMDETSFGHEFAEIKIVSDSKGLVVTITTAPWSQDTKLSFACQNY